MEKKELIKVLKKEIESLNKDELEIFMTKY